MGIGVVVQQEAGRKKMLAENHKREMARLRKQRQRVREHAQKDLTNNSLARLHFGKNQSGLSLNVADASRPKHEIMASIPQTSRQKKKERKKKPVPAKAQCNFLYYFLHRYINSEGERGIPPRKQLMKLLCNQS